MRLRLVAALPVLVLSFRCGAEPELSEPSHGDSGEADAGGTSGEGGVPSVGGGPVAGAPGEGGAGSPSEAGAGAGPRSFLDSDLVGPLPDRLSELGLYPELPSRETWHERAAYYEPRYPLWSNGSDKQRFIVLPLGASVDTSSPSWEFPSGTTFFKTFSYPDGGRSSTDGAARRAIETRVLRRTDEGYEFAAYRWNEDQADAELLDGQKPVRVSIEIDGESFEHQIPSRLECRTCHESQDARVIGFDALRLNHALAGTDDTQLTGLFEREVLSELPDDPGSIEHDDPRTREVLGYLQGNCTHCHNGSDGPSSAFDLRFPVALENLIGIETTSELFGGLRVSPGDPEASALYKGIARDVEDGDAQPMPPVGVQRVDAEAVTLIYDWISSLDL
jgi:hypothetical protein